MSGRCKSCNTELYDDELTSKYLGTNEYIDLCFRCLDIAMNPEAVDDTYHTTDYYNEET